jgi:hypothetical protein
MISSKNEHVFISDLSNCTLLSIFEPWWVYMNEGKMQPIASNNSRHTLSCRFYLHCRIDATSSAGMVCIICHQVLCHPLEYVTSSIGKHLIAIVHITKLNELTESELTELTSTMVDETALASFKLQAS